MKKILPYYHIIPYFLLIFICAVFWSTNPLKGFSISQLNSHDYQLTPELDSNNSFVDSNVPENDQGSTAPTSPVDPPIPDTLPSESFTFSSDLIIQAVNPGYTVDGTRDVGEFILLRRLTDSSLSLASYSIRYVNSSGTGTTLLNFSEGTSMTGETLLMRLARSPGSNLSDATYMTTLAMSSGQLEILYNDTVVDSVCWGTKADCSTSFKSASPTTLVRDLENGFFAHEFDYIPPFDSESPALSIPPPSVADDPTINDSDESVLTGSCKGIEFSEIFTYYSADSKEQFIELYNTTDSEIFLSDCTLSYKKKSYALSGSIAADSYYAYYPSQSETPFTLTKNPSSSNSIELINNDGTLVDILTYSHGQKKATSYARFYDAAGDDLWQSTYNPTPNSANLYQEYRTCPTGKVINPATGNCINSSSIKTSSTAECPAGKYRNPLTGRCKNVESASTEPKPCAEGYERNPETNRCRKVQGTNEGAGYALVPSTYTPKTTFIATGIIILLVSIGAVYIILQFRREISRTTRKISQRLHSVTKDLLTRRVSLHRHKKP